MSDFIEIKNLEKTYFMDKTAIPVLRGISISFSKGDMVSIMGVSGVGKSTFLQVLGTLDRPSSGSVFFDGKDLFKRSDSDLALFRNQKIGFVYQFHHLLPEFSALENVMLPALIGKKERFLTFSKAKGLLNDVGLSHRINHKPGELSGGEQQRVAIARSLVMDPAVILADEPTGNLDRKTAQDIENLMINLNIERQTTFILATHNEELASKLTKQLRITNGIFEV
jgi:lipoprotein-releasing system ATP-binding protein